MAKPKITLVYVFIGITVIALLCGAAVVGLELIRDSQVRSVIGKRDEYIAAIKQFREKYDALPGDMRTATDIWGIASSNPALCPSTLAEGTQTCNGNGDGHIADFAGRCGSICLYESVRAWQHLANAGLIGGSYSGISVQPLPKFEVRPGINIPKIPTAWTARLLYKLGQHTRYGWQQWQKIPPDMNDAGFTLFYLGQFSNFGWWPDDYGHLFMIGATKFNNWTYGEALTAAEAHALDSKFDDGKPGSGMIMTFKPAAREHGTQYCATSDNQREAIYNVTHPGPACALMLKLGI
jgi:hypothetical protein